jgi:hypothetical protein
MSYEMITIGARVHILDPRHGSFQGNITVIDDTDSTVKITFDAKFDTEDEWYGFEAASRGVAKAEKAEKAAAALQRKQQAPPPTPSSPSAVTRASWTRSTQTDEDELAISATFDGRDRFEQELKEIMLKRIDAKVRELKTDIVASVTQAYDDTLWTSPITHRHHLRMGFHSDPYYSGRARRWQGAETGNNGGGRKRKSQKKK